MQSCINDSWAVAGGVIINYSGAPESLRIPTRLGDMNVTEIGDAAFSNNKTLRRVVIPPEIKRIGKEAFRRCEKLQQVFLPSRIKLDPCAFSLCPSLEEIFISDLELDGDAYRELMDFACSTDGSEYICPFFPSIDIANEAVKAADINSNRIAADLSVITVPPMTRIFRDPDPSAGIGFGLNTPTYSFGTGGVETVSENREFMKLVRGEVVTPTDKKTEERNDELERLGGAGRLPQRTAVFAFDNSATKEVEGRFRISASVRIGYFFYQSRVPITMDGISFHIYRRHYLTLDKDMKYLRRDVAVFNKKGLVSNRALSRMIYAKYKLPSLL